MKKKMWKVTGYATNRMPTADCYCCCCCCIFLLLAAATATALPLSYATGGDPALSFRPHTFLPPPPPPFPPHHSLPYPSTSSLLPHLHAGKNTRREEGGLRGGSGRRAEGAGGEGGEGNQVLVHWKQGDPGVSAAAPAPRETGSRQSGDEEDDSDVEELLAPAPPRERLSYTRYQLELLNGIFDAVRYPNSVQKQLIARRVGISREQVKIWFQNRRRKDVVSNKVPQSSSSSAAAEAAVTTATEDNSASTSATEKTVSPTSTAISLSDTQRSNKNDHTSIDVLNQDSQKSSESQSENGLRTGMVPDYILKSCVSELNRFSDEKIKERKEKKKAKGKRRSQAAPRASNGSSQSVEPVSKLFRTYDMLAPPNKITPSAAYLDTSANRFSHSVNSSAFSTPREELAMGSTMPRLAWNGIDAGLGQSLGGGVAQSGGYGDLGLRMGAASTSQAPTVGLPRSRDTLPGWTDHLAYRQQLECSTRLGSGRDTLLPPSFLSLASPTRNPPPFSDALGQRSALSPSSSFGLNHVFPYPIVADPPAMLSGLHHQDPLRVHQWPYSHATPPPLPSYPWSYLAMMNSVDPAYKPAVISTVSNPYYSPQLSHLHQWPLQTPHPPQGSGHSQ